jgi:hypothetical protein
VSDHPLAGDFSVETSARRIRRYRYAEERLMRMLGGWIALSPELPVKLLFGRHVWDCAQHTDLWGRRLPELRAPAQQSEPPNDAFVRFVDLLEGCEAPGDSQERVVGMYRVLKPHLLATYEAHLAAANPVYEPPTRRILERCIGEERRHVAAGAVVLERLLTDGEQRRRADAWEARLVGALRQAGVVTGDTPEPARALRADGADPARDVVAVGPGFDAPLVMDPALLLAIEAHARAVIAGDPARLTPQISAAARPVVLDTYARGGSAKSYAVVAQAKIGAVRLVKLRFEGARGPWIVLQQWRKLDGEWRVVEAELLFGSGS